MAPPKRRAWWKGFPMSNVKALDVADFQRQLSLLLKSDIPLPESLAELAEHLGGGKLSDVAWDVSKAVGEGERLSEAMGRHPLVFSSFHVRMVEAGEKSGTLPETLAQIAANSMANARLSRIARDIALYPVFAIWFTGLVSFLILVFIVPHFVSIFEEMLEGEPLPWLTDKIFALSALAQGASPLLIAGLAVYAAFFLWLFSGSNRANRFFLGVLKRLPGSGRVYRNLDMARLASTWSTLMGRGVPAGDALSVTADLMDDRKVSGALMRVSEGCAKGEPLPALLEKERRTLSPMLPLTVRHVPESALPEELGNLAALFRERASSASSKMGMTWEILLILFLWVFVGVTVLSMFLPLISIIRKLGG